MSGLDSGANDYLTKPFELPELMARVRLQIRNDRWGNTTESVYGPIKFNTSSRRVLVNDSPIDLSARAACRFRAAPPARWSGSEQKSDCRSSDQLGY